MTARQCKHELQALPYAKGFAHPFLLIALVLLSISGVFYAKKSISTSTLLGSVLQASTSGVTYYVSPSGLDSNNGSEGSPWKTVSYAIHTAEDGSTIIVKPGTYQERIIFNRADINAGLHVKAETPYMAKLRNNRNVIG